MKLKTLRVFDGYIGGSTLERPEKASQIKTIKEGWVCPKCGKVLAPWMPSCDCHKRKTKEK